jgi:hypothetical protein
MVISGKLLIQGAVAALIGAGALALTATTASAYVVCNGEGDCWHTDHRYHYDPALNLQWHPDDWYFHRDWAADHDHHWREYHDGRGYWKGGLWVTL